MSAYAWKRQNISTEKILTDTHFWQKWYLVWHVAWCWKVLRRVSARSRANSNLAYALTLMNKIGRWNDEKWIGRNLLRVWGFLPNNMKQQMSWWTVFGLGFCTRNNWWNNLGKCNLSVFLGTWVDHDTNATWKKVWFESSEIWNRSFLQTPVEICSWKDTKKRRGLFSRQEQALWSDRFGWRWNCLFVRKNVENM